MTYVAVDAMGGDHAPAAVVRGAVEALEAEPHLGVALVGREDEIRAELGDADFGERLIIVHADEVVQMHEAPVEALRRKPNCSILKAVGLVREGVAGALVSAGNTGGVVAATTFALKRLPGAKRAGIAVGFPGRTGHTVLMDAGANIDCKPIHLVQYAVMGCEYAREVFGVENPRVAVLSVGGEEGKGNRLVKTVSAALKAAEQIDFVGNVEGQQIFHGDADVVVCEGFVGNVILKASEGLAEVFLHRLVEDLDAVLGHHSQEAKQAISRFRESTDYQKYGGAPLMGHQGAVFICHGRSSPHAICNAILVASQYVAHGVNERIEAGLAQLGADEAVAAVLGGHE